MVDFREHLRRQLNFLRSSANAYDEGYLDEAYRIATAIRVLIHNTSNSVSLLHHLNADSIPLLSTTEPASPRAIFYDGMSLIQFANETGLTVKPALELATDRRYIPANDWWTEEIFVHDKTRLARKHIALFAANQDGGAHVDASLNNDYAKLKQGIWRYPVADVVPDEVQQSQLVFLRQMAYELLNSPALEDMARYGQVTEQNKAISPPLSKWTPPPVPKSDLEQMPHSEVDRLRYIVSENHFRLLDNLYHSSLGGATNPLGNYQLDQQRGFQWSLTHWLKPLLHENLITRSPNAPGLYTITNRGRAFVARIIEIGH